MQYALTNMQILNGHADMTPVCGKAILVDGEIIRDIVPADAIPADYAVVDLEGGYLLPGLINLHAHLPSSGKPSKKKTDYKKLAKLLKLGVARTVVRKLCEGSAKQALYAGTTTVRVVGGVLDFDTWLRDRIQAGKTVGPRILAANYAVSVEGGHMTGSVALPAHSPEEAAAMVRALAETKPDLIKLMITGGVLDAEVPGEPGVLRMPAEYVKAAVEQAHALGYKVAAHVESGDGMTVALENGVDTLEHGGKMSDGTIELFRKSGAVLVGTLSPAVPFAEMPQSVTGFSDMDVFNGKALFHYMLDCIKACLAGGITVGLGTDAGCPFTTHYDMWREVWYFASYCGVTPTFALHTATEINARIAGLEGVTGTVEAGRCADFMVVRDNPLEDLRALREPTAVIARGRLLHHPKAKKYPVVEQALDDVMRR